MHLQGRGWAGSEATERSNLLNRRLSDTQLCTPLLHPTPRIEVQQMQKSRFPLLRIHGYQIFCLLKPGVG